MWYSSSVVRHCRACDNKLCRVKKVCWYCLHWNCQVEIIANVIEASGLDPELLSCVVAYIHAEAQVFPSQHSVLLGVCKGPGNYPYPLNRVMLYFVKIGLLIKQMFSLLLHKHVVQTFCFVRYVNRPNLMHTFYAYM